MIVWLWSSTLASTNWCTKFPFAVIPMRLLPTKDLRAKANRVIVEAIAWDSVLVFHQTSFGFIPVSYNSLPMISQNINPSVMPPHANLRSIFVEWQIPFERSTRELVEEPTRGQSGSTDSWWLAWCIRVMVWRLERTLDEPSIYKKELLEHHVVRPVFSNKPTCPDSRAPTWIYLLKLFCWRTMETYFAIPPTVFGGNSRKSSDPLVGSSGVQHLQGAVGYCAYDFIGHRQGYSSKLLVGPGPSKWYNYHLFICYIFFLDGWYQSIEFDFFGWWLDPEAPSFIRKCFPVIWCSNPRLSFLLSLDCSSLGCAVWVPYRVLTSSNLWVTTCKVVVTHWWTCWDWPSGCGANIRRLKSHLLHGTFIWSDEGQVIQPTPIPLWIAMSKLPTWSLFCFSWQKFPVKYQVIAHAPWQSTICKNMLNGFEFCGISKLFSRSWCIAFRCSQMRLERQMRVLKPSPFAGSGPTTKKSSSIPIRPTHTHIYIYIDI